MHHSLFFLVSSCLSLVLGQNPEYAVTPLGRELPKNLFFFPNSTSAVRYSIPERNIYVSHDSGKSWRRDMNMPGGLVDDVLPHPFNEKLAFLITRPRDITVAQTHYRTEDQGQTWIPFELPPSPARRISLSFHSDPEKFGYILYQCEVCDSENRDRICHGETYITKDAFKSPPQRILDNTVKCQFAHSTTQFKPDVHPDLVYCIQAADGGARLYSSTDFFANEKNVQQPCASTGFITSTTLDVFAATPDFAVFALETAGETMLCVTKDMKTWATADIPVRFRRNEYTLVSAGHALSIDVSTSPQHGIGTLYVSDASGTLFAERLRDTNWSNARWLGRVGLVDAEAVGGVPGVAIVNVVANAAEVVARGADKQLRTMITYDGAHSWVPMSPNLYPRPVSKTLSGSPGVIMGVGSPGPAHLPYTESDTFLSTDAGSTWTKVSDSASMYEFGDAGSILVTINNEHAVSELRYSLDLGTSWYVYDFDVTLTVLDLLPVPGVGSWKFLLFGQHSPSRWADPYVLIYFDFANTRKSKCTEDDFETWYASVPGGDTCFMGSKQPSKRRKPHRDCYVGDTPTGQLAAEENCPCSDADYECDRHFEWDGHSCIAVGLEAIPPGMCTSVDDVYMGSSGYRKIPGNTCIGGSKDAQVQKSCQPEKPTDKKIVHHTFEFPDRITQHQYFENSTVRTILVLLLDHSLWQSSNEGYAWTRLYPEERFTQFYMHKYDARRAYLLTNTEKFYFTVDGGRTWATRTAPSPPTMFRVLALRFHPDPDKLIWIGDRDCKDFHQCHAEAQYSLDNGKTWRFVEKYVANCAWAVGTKLLADEEEILCESYSTKTESQMLFQMGTNPLALVEGTEYFKKQTKIFDEVVGFTKFSEFLVVAELRPSRMAYSLKLQVSLDGVHFAAGQFPPNMRPETHAYTILDSSTHSLFIHMTMTELPYWGNVLKSNSNGTYFGLSAENVNRDGRGYVDFEKMIGLDGIALANVVSNADEALLTKRKVLQSRITHNDGGTWTSLVPPTHDSHGNAYPCATSQCALHVHGYTERYDPSATYSSASVVGLIMAVGNVGESLIPYDQSDTFLSRDGGFTWQEVHKDAHLWKVGDSGSIIVIANDEGPTDHVLFSINEGLSWSEYKFSADKIRIRYILTVPADTSRRFLLLGHPPYSTTYLAVYIDFTALTSRQCVIDVDDPGHDDFELWSPSDERAERCLFGRQTVYHRRVRDADCYVGTSPKAKQRIERACSCVKADFECEFNHYKNSEDECVLAPGTSPLSNDDKCEDGKEYWYERTPYRKIAFSSCEGGEPLDRGPRHTCLRSSRRNSFFWVLLLLVVVVFGALVWFLFYRNAG
ncbi:vacuolar protein sorting/targeting protein 10 [Mycena polygramma]|nr:vacuolar protein sorting/targeting protein 10 [Mycena polygramma]